MDRTYNMNAVTAGSAFLGDAVKRAARISAFIVFTAIGAQLAVRLPYTPVPVTMQTMFVLLAGVVLGPRDGFYAMAGYLALGLAGAPVFAGFAFGPAVMFGPTGGYLLAFPLAALVAGRISGLRHGSTPVLAAAVLCAQAVILLCGAAYLSLLTGASVSLAVSTGLVPFIAGDAVKSSLAVIITRRR